MKHYIIFITTFFLFAFYTGCNPDNKSGNYLDKGINKPNILFIFSDDQCYSTVHAFQNRMEWFLNAKYGMFIHFGLYSQLGGIYEGNESGRYAEWIQANQQIPKSDYVNLINTWNPEKFDTNKIVKNRLETVKSLNSDLICRFV